MWCLPWYDVWVFYKTVCLCVEVGGVRLHLPFDYLRRLVFIRLRIGVVTSSRFIAVQPNMLTRVALGDQPWFVSDTGIYFKYLKFWLCVCFSVRIIISLNLNLFFGFAWSRCLLFLLFALVWRSRQLWALLCKSYCWDAEIEMFYCKRQSWSTWPSPWPLTEI